MSRDLFGIEKGLSIFATNGDESVFDLLVGTAVPGGDAAEQDAAPIGSQYRRSGTSEVYKKIATVGATADWELQDGTFDANMAVRPERVIAATATNPAVPSSIDLVASPFSDDEGVTLTSADFQVGDFLIVNASGTPALVEVTAVSAPNITIGIPATASPLAANDNFIIQNYLPDTPDDQEAQALVQYTGTDLVKIADVNWSIATGITLSTAYAGAAGDVVAGDSVEAAIQKLDGNNDAQDLALGVGQGSTDLGTFTGAIISDSNSVKGALQELELAAEEIDANVDDLVTLTGLPENSTDLGTFTGNTIVDGSDLVTALQALETQAEAGAIVNVGPADIAQNTPTVVDQVLADDFQSVEWIVTAHDIGDPTNIKVLKVMGVHNGSAVGDATVVKDNIYVKIRRGNFNLKADVVLSGTGAAQEVRLVLDTSDSDGIRYTVSRAETTPAL